MHKAYIKPAECVLCPKCAAARVCPIKAIIRIGGEDPNVVDPNLCHGVETACQHAQLKRLS